METQKTYLKDYKPPTFAVENVHLFFDLHEDHARVVNTARYKKIDGGAHELALDGVNLELVSIAMDGQPLAADAYTVDPSHLTLKNPPAAFELKIETKLYPHKNTSLEGLYKSGPHFVTQCEAQGFRKITYFMDRPDVMTKYSVEIEAEEQKYPILLSNGDRGTQKLKASASGRHRAGWSDPHKKPCYLFALFAGDLGVIRDSFTTASGRKVNLEIYAPHGKQARCTHAMESLKHSMKWDEQAFGREYDLGDYMIVAIDDFNAGAMENKGLNIFNSRLVLADAQTATDADYHNIESVVAHEYFHNWTGNRVTLNSWFQLSLKEGLTVFRDQEFSADQTDRGIQRIRDVDSLRERQFPEDAGPNAHPVRPESCMAVDNFFTMTIYEKGAELIRMMQTTVGRKGFRKGMDLYFERHDGQAVTTDDFAAAIADANKQDFSQLKRWYSQAGTPHVKVEESFAHGTFKLKFTQSCAPTPGQPTKKPFQIPIELGLLDAKGANLPLNHPKIQPNSDGVPMFNLTQETEELEFTGLATKPVASLFRGFSAPVIVEHARPEDEVFFLMANDTDGFNRREASQNAGRKVLGDLMRAKAAGQTLIVPDKYMSAWARALNADVDPGYLVYLLSRPTDSVLALSEKTYFPEAAYEAREFLKLQIARANANKLQDIYMKWHGVDADKADSKTAGHRMLKNFVLSHLALLPKGRDLVWKQFDEAKNMTDSLHALELLVSLQDPERERATEAFYKRWQQDALVLNKWFSAFANNPRREAFADVKALWGHPRFNVNNPNNVYALLWAYGRNLPAFHANPQQSYPYYVDRILEIDALNPQVAARLCTVFNVLAKLPETHQALAKSEIRRAVATGKLSKNALEILGPMVQNA